VKAALLILTAAVALICAAPVWAEGISPDDRGYSRATNPAQSLTPDDRAFGRAPALEQEWQPAPTIVRVSQRSFDWSDAGLGAASGFGIAVVLLGSVLVLRRRVIVA
jgi:hypothetical protein